MTHLTQEIVLLFGVRLLDTALAKQLDASLLIDIRPFPYASSRNYESCVKPQHSKIGYIFSFMRKVSL